MVKVIEYLIPESNMNRTRKNMSPRYITVHNTGNSNKGANALANSKYVSSVNGAKNKVSWHYTVDDSYIYRNVPDDEIAWHTGTLEGNSKSIGIEICMNSDGDINKATENAAELTAYLCRLHNIGIENVVQHNHWSGKDCPSMLRRGIPYSWNTFKSRVSYYINKYSDYSNVDNIIKELNMRGVITDISLWGVLLNSDSDLYWLARKACEMTVKYERNNKLDLVNDIVWELGSWGVMTDKGLWLNKLSYDTNAYWLAYKICNLCKGV